MLLLFEEQQGLAEQAKELAEAALPHVGLQDEQVGIARSDSSIAGLSIIATLPGAPRQPFHKDADKGHVYSVLVALNRWRFCIASRPAPILVCESWSLCHGGAGLEPDEVMVCIRGRRHRASRGAQLRVRLGVARLSRRGL